MHFKSIREFLGYIEECHIALIELYKRLSVESNDDKVRLLLYFLENKEQLSYQYIHDYVQQAPPYILETWVDNIFDNLEEKGTILRGEGLKNKEEKKVIFLVMYIKKIPRLKEIIEQTDDQAFLLVMEASEILGRGH